MPPPPDPLDTSSPLAITLADAEPAPRQATPALTDVWAVGPGEHLCASRYHLVVLVFLAALGAVVGPLGTLSLPEGLGVSSLWPANAIQVVGGIWFGGWGAVAGTLFAIYSNIAIGGSLANIVGFISANLVQGLLPA